MEHILQALTHFSLDPFRRLAAAGNPERALRDAGLTEAEARYALEEAGLDAMLRVDAAFDSCETCMDPGDDSDPFDDSIR